MIPKKEEKILSFLAIVSKKNPKDDDINHGEQVVVGGNDTTTTSIQGSSTTKNTNHDDDTKVIASSSAKNSATKTKRNTKKPQHTKTRFLVLCTKFSQKTKLVLYQLFLPTGYPQSVQPGYIQYQIYDSIQGLCSYLRGVISTGAILTAAGVGNANATATSAAIQWAIKDGCGMLGGLLFSYFCSVYFDAYVKEFRLFADVMNNFGLLLDMSSPLFVLQYHRTLASMMATLCRVMCGMAAGATKHCITEHFANRGNSADLSAKEGTQETLVSLMGLMLGIGLANFLQEMEENCRFLRQLGGEVESSLWYYQYSAFYATWLVFGLLTILHIWVNYQGVKILKLNTLNRARCKFVFRGILNDIQMQLSTTTKTSTGAMHHPHDKKYEKKHEDNIISVAMSTPEECNESLWESWTNLMWNRDNMLLGTSMEEAFRGIESNTTLVQSVLNVFKEEDYILTINRKGLICVTLFTNNGDKKKQGETVGIVIQDEQANIIKKNRTMLKSYLHAMIVQQSLKKENKNKNKNSNIMKMSTTSATDEETQKRMNDAMTLIKVSKHHLDSLFKTDDDKTLLDLLHDFGWNIDRLYLGFQNE